MKLNQDDLDFIWAQLRLPANQYNSMGLIQAFLNPTAYDHTTAGQVALNIVRARDSGVGSLNEVRASLYQPTGMSTLKPYESWDDFGANLLHPESLLNFIMAYAADDVLALYGAADTDWKALQLSDPAGYATVLRNAAGQAINDASFMSGPTQNRGFQKIDFWIGGLAEAKVTGGMLGSTFDFLFAMQMIRLQNGDRFHYLDRPAGTHMLTEIDSQLFSELVMRNTGDYLDSRGVFSPNGRGNASEILGGIDRVFGGDGDDLMYGGLGNDAMIGWTGNDTLTGGLGSDAFRFDSNTGVDLVMDFGAGDVIQMSRAAFRGLNPGNLSSQAFVSGDFDGAMPTGGTTNSRLYDNTSDRSLWYDANGSRGGTVAVLVGVITTNGTTPASLTNANFQVVA